MTPTLRTERLLLEPYTSADEEDFVALFQDARVSKWMGDGPESEAEDRALFGRIFTKVYAEIRFMEPRPRHRTGGRDRQLRLRHPGPGPVHATVAKPNQPSLALLGKIGFQHIRDIEEDDGSTTCLLTRDRGDARGQGI